MTKRTSSRRWGMTEILTLFALLLHLLHQITGKALQTIPRESPQRHNIPYHSEQPQFTPYIRKRDGEAHGHYDRGVPEHFVMSEHGPEIHLDIDEHGTSVDTHPAALSMDTATDPHEHCCHHNHCEHTCHCCCGHHGICTGGKRSFKDHHHHHHHYRESDSDRVHMSDMVEQTPLVRHRFPRPRHCYGGVCRDRIEEFRVHGPEPYEFIGHPTTTRPHDEIPAQIMYTADERITADPRLDRHLNGFGRITHDSSVEHETGATRASIENYCYGGVCENSASDNHVRVPALRYQQPLSVPARAAYSPVAGSTAVGMPPTDLPQREPIKMEEVSHVIASDSELQKGVEGDQQTPKASVGAKDESLLGTKRAVGHQQKSLTNLTEEYRPEADQHMTGQTRGTIEKYISVHENQLHVNPSASAEKGEGTVISFDNASGGLAKKDGQVPEHYGVLDVNPDELSLKRSRVETNNLSARKRIVTQVS